MIVFKTLTLAREQLATLPVYFFLAYHAASLLNAWGVGSSAGQYYLELTINFNDICDNYKYENKTIGDEGITVDFRFIKVHTSN